jgi:hypothetical protein
MPARLALALQADGWVLRSDIIWAKCLSGGARVYARTQKGDMPMTIKDMVRLDPTTVKLWNGKQWTQAIAWNETPRPTKERPLELVLRSGERIGCTPDHRWPTQRGLIEARALQVGDILDSTHLPEPDKPERPAGLFGVGWFVGMYLAEGSMTGDTIQISSHKDEYARFERLEALAKHYHGTASWYEFDGNKAAIHVRSKILNAILDIYLSGRTAKDKHLAPICWQCTNGFLHDILLGYLEGDGHWDALNKRWRLGFTRNYNLEQDLRTLCARLDIQLRLNPSVATYQNGEATTFRGEIRFERSKHYSAKQDSEIVEIRHSRARKFWDIAVEDDPHLFALASGVLTHNSNPMPESVTDRPTKAHEYIYLLSKEPRYWYDQEAIREKANYDGRKDTRLKGSNKYKESVIPGQKAHTYAAQGWERWPNQTEDGCPARNKRTVWHVNTRGYPEAHFAVFPPELIEPCVLAGCPPTVCDKCGAPYVRDVESQSRYEKREPAHAPNNAPTKVDSTGWKPPIITDNGFKPACECGHGTTPGIVLDPFAGSGTTGAVAVKHRRRAILIDLSENYAELQKDRTQVQITLPIGI